MMWWQSMTSNESDRLTRFFRNDLEVCIRLKSVTRASTFKATNSPSVTLWRFFNVTFHTNSNSTSTSVCHVCVGQLFVPNGDTPVGLKSPTGVSPLGTNCCWTQFMVTLDVSTVSCQSLCYCEQWWKLLTVSRADTRVHTNSFCHALITWFNERAQTTPSRTSTLKVLLI